MTAPEDSAADVALELAHDEPRKARLAALFNLGKEGLPVLAYRRMHECALGIRSGCVSLEQFPVTAPESEVGLSAGCRAAVLALT